MGIVAPAGPVPTMPGITSRALAGLPNFATTSLTISQLRGVAKACSSSDAACSSCGRYLRKAVTSGMMPRLVAQACQSSGSTSRLRWMKRLASALESLKVTALSSRRLPAAMMHQPSGSSYSPTLRSRMS